MYAKLAQPISPLPLPIRDREATKSQKETWENIGLVHYNDLIKVNKVFGSYLHLTAGYLK